MRDSLLLQGDTTKVARASSRTSRSGGSILKPGVGNVVEPNSPRLSFADNQGQALEDVSVIPPRRRPGAYSEEEDPCAECAEINCRSGRWLLLPLIVLLVVGLIYVLQPPEHHPPPPPPPGGGSFAGELSDELSDV